MESIWKNKIFHFLLISFSFIVLGVVIYSNTLEVPFYFDDIKKIKENPNIRMEQLNIDGIKNSIWAEKSPSKRPVSYFSFALNYYFHQYDPKGYHVVNIIIHVINGILLFYFLRITLVLSGFRSPYLSAAAFFAALIWLVHPVQTQSVTYIVQRQNSLAAMFYLLSFLLYIRGRLAAKKAPGNPSPYLWWAGASIVWLLALGSKQTAATLPFFILLYEWFFFRDLSREWLKHHLKYILGVVVLFGALAVLFSGVNPLEKFAALRDYANHQFTMGERVLTQFRVVIYYISLVLFPHPARLNLDYDFPLSHSLLDPVTTLLSLGLILGLLLAAVLLAKRERLISFFIFWYFGNLVIESSIIPLAVIYEHRLYLPSMALCLLFVFILYRYIKQGRFVSIALSLVLVVLSVWTYQRNQVWRNPVTFWSDIVKKSGEKARPRNNLGNALYQAGRIDDSISQFRRALEINPDYAEAHNNLGLSLAGRGKMEEAIEHFNEALRINPDYGKAHYNLGTTYVHLGEWARAYQQFQEAIRLVPQYDKAYYNLAVLLARQGRLEEAVNNLLIAIRINPSNADAHIALGTIYRHQGKEEEARRHFREGSNLKKR